MNAQYLSILSSPPRKARVQRERGESSIEAREVERGPQEAQGGHGECNSITLPPAQVPHPKKYIKKLSFASIGIDMNKLIMRKK